VFDFLKPKKAKAPLDSSPDPLWELDLPVQEIRAVIVDTELTGLDRKHDSIVSIGAVKMAGGRVEIGRTFYQLVNPHMEMKAKTVIVHEITPSEVLEKPDIGPVLSEFLEFCEGDILIGHYVSLDLAFINRELKRTRNRTLENPALDTMSLMHWWRSNTPSSGPDAFTAQKFELVEIAKELGIQVQGAHNALMDAFMTAQVFQRLLPRLQAFGIKTLGDLLRIGHPNRKLQPRGGMI
jgi:DNA polymerase-3 subunit epsilon